MPDIPCPHCAQDNEKEREVCWACGKLLKSPANPSFGSVNVSRTMEVKIAVNGREYASLEDVPEPFRSSLKSDLGKAVQAMRSGKKGSIIVNGAEYERLEDVPEEFRSKIKDALAQAKPERREAVPSGASTFRIGPLTIKSHGRYLYEPLDMDLDAPVARPDGFRLDENGPERRISWRWISWDSVIGIYFAAVFGVPFAFMLYAYKHTPADKPWPAQAMAVLLLFGLPPAVFTYWWLAYLVNRTTLRLDAARISVRHGPLPYWGAQDVLRTDIARVFSEKRTCSSSDTSDGTAFEPETTYLVKLQLKGGETLTLVSGLLAPEQALYLEQQIRRL